MNLEFQVHRATKNGIRASFSRLIEVVLVIWLGKRCCMEHDNVESGKTTIKGQLVMGVTKLFGFLEDVLVVGTFCGFYW